MKTAPACRKAASLPLVAKPRRKGRVAVVSVGPTTYRMTLNDGHKIETRANSAAEAIEWALRKYRGYTVAECHSGMTEQEAAVERDAAQYDSRRNKHAMAGIVPHEVPPHVAYAEGEVIEDVSRARRDDTVPMFGADVGVGGKLAD